MSDPARRLVAAITGVAPEHVETLAPEAYRLAVEALQRAHDAGAEMMREAADKAICVEASKWNLSWASFFATVRDIVRSLPLPNKGPFHG